MFVSCAGNREDVLLARAFGDRRIGFYVDVGANDPVRGSTTKFLYDRGWRGINIEPNSSIYALIARARPLDVNICAAISEHSGKCPFYIVEDDPALSTIDGEIAGRYQSAGRPVRAVHVQTVPLNAILEDHAAERRIDVLKIDVEGAEEIVLRTVDLRRWRPRVLVIEAVRPKEFIQTHHEWESRVLDQGYTFCLFDGINRIYAYKDEAELIERLSWPVCALDQFQTLEYWELSEYRKLGKVARKAACLVQRIMNSRPKRLR